MPPLSDFDRNEVASICEEYLFGLLVHYLPQEGRLLRIAFHDAFSFFFLRPHGIHGNVDPPAFIGRLVKLMNLRRGRGQFLDEANLLRLPHADTAALVEARRNDRHHHFIGQLVIDHVAHKHVRFIARSFLDDFNRLVGFHERH